MEATPARNETIAQIWVEYPERLVTISTGIVHVAHQGVAMCSTRTAVRVTTSDAAPTCKNCGAA